MKPQDRSSPRRRNHHRREAQPAAPGHGSESGAASDRLQRLSPYGGGPPGQRHQDERGPSRARGGPLPFAQQTSARRRPGSAPAVSGCDRLAGQERCGVEIATGPVPLPGCVRLGFYPDHKGPLAAKNSKAVGVWALLTHHSYMCERRLPSISRPCCIPKSAT